MNADEGDMLSLAVCACTYRRPGGLRRLLDGLAAQTFNGFSSGLGACPQLKIIIADNEGNAQVKDLCQTFQASSKTPVIYVHEPQQGISYARNACLDHLPTDCDFFALIDDDEVPEPDWLDQLLLAQSKTKADVVQGRVVPHFEEPVPRWIAEGGVLRGAAKGSRRRVAANR
jgi:glycosyltransferase involved in cell wall biosynthesis